MAKRITVAISVLILTAMLVGCWDAQDISDMNIPIVGGYDVPDRDKDKNEKDATIVVTGLIPNLDPEAKEKVRIDRISAQTVGESRGIRSQHNPDVYSTGMVQVSIFGEELARSGLDDVMDALFRDQRMKRAVYMAVVDGRADELLHVEAKNAPNLGVYLLGLLRHAQGRGFMPCTTMLTYGVDANSVGNNPVLPLIKARDKERVELAGAGIFKKNKLIAKVLLRDTRSLVLLRGLKSSGDIPFIVAKDGVTLDRGTVDVTNSRKVGVERTGDQYTFRISVKLKGMLVDHSRKTSFIKHEEMLKEINKAVADEIEEDCSSFVTRMQEEFGVDCIDIAKYALAKWRNELKDRVEQEDFIKKMRIIVDVQVDISTTGERT